MQMLVCDLFASTSLLTCCSLRNARHMSGTCCQNVLAILAQDLGALVHGDLKRFTPSTVLLCEVMVSSCSVPAAVAVPADVVDSAGAIGPEGSSLDVEMLGSESEGIANGN